MGRMGWVCALIGLGCASETRESVRPGPAPESGELPIGMPGIVFSAPASFEWSGELAPGSATFTAAPLWDWEASDMPSAFGAGTHDLTIDGVSYVSAAAESFSAVMDDGAGTEYLIVGQVVFETDAAGVDVARVLYVVTPSADFALGASVALDGGERVALFGAGPVDSEYPEVMGAAASGTLTFTAGSLSADGSISATLSGDFGRIAWEERPDDPPPDDPPPAVTAGAYRLTIGGLVDAQCDGSLAGEEGTYATLAAGDLGFVDADVTLSGALTLEGTGLTAGFGTSSLVLDWDGESYSTFADVVTPGPFGVDRSFSAIAVLPADAGPIPAFVAAFFDDRTGTGGWCALTWDATLSPAP